MKQVSFISSIGMIAILLCITGMGIALQNKYSKSNTDNTQILFDVAPATVPTLHIYGPDEESPKFITIVATADLFAPDYDKESKENLGVCIEDETPMIWQCTNDFCVSTCLKCYGNWGKNPDL